MARLDFGNKPINSTQLVSADPSTATLVAEINSSNVGWQAGLYQVRWSVGASTAGSFRLELAASTSLAAGAIRDQYTVFTGSNITSEFVFDYEVIAATDRLRIVPTSSFTGFVCGKINAVQLT